MKNVIWKLCIDVECPTMRRKLTELLRLCDLTEGEIRLYLLLLKLRRATVSQLIVESGWKRMTVYRTVQRLVDRGLLERRAMNAKQDSFVPLSLSALVDRVQAQERKLRHLELHLKNLDRFLPFMDVNGDHEQELIEVRDGVEAMREEYLSFPELCKGEYLHIGSMQNCWKTMQLTYECPEERNFIHQRLSRGITARIINIYTPDAETFRVNDSREMRTSKLTEDLPIRKNYLGMSEGQMSYFLCEPDHPRVIVIRQPDLVAMHRQHFERLWDSSISV